MSQAPVLEPGLTPASGNDRASEIGMQDVLRFLRLSWKQILIGTVTAICLAVVYLLVIPTTYSATTSLIYDPSSAPSFIQNSRWLEPSAEMTTRIESQVEVIKSEGVATAVIRKLKLAADPEFGDVDRIAEAVARSVVTSAEATDAGNGQGAGQAAGGAGAGGAAGAKKKKVAELDPEDALPEFLKRLNAYRVGMSSVINISFSAQDPKKATRIVNAIARAYIAQSLEQRAHAARNGSVWLQERIDDLRALSFNAMRDAERFKSEGGRSSTESAVRLAELESIAQTYRRMYEIFLLKLTETSQRVSYPVADSRVLSVASPSRVQTRPKKSLVLAFAAALGGFLGGAYSLARMSLDRRIRHGEMMGAHGVSCLGTLPVLKTGEATRLRDILIGGALSEMRQVHMAIIATAGAKPCHIGVVGVSAGAGVTSCAAKLAQIFAATGQRTLLIDANTADPALSQEFVENVDVGVREVLRGAVSAKDAIVDDLSPGFALLPAAVGSNDEQFATPGTMLSAVRPSVTLDDVSAEFDVCLIDLPALDDSLEAQLIAPLLDGVVVIVEQGVTWAPDLAVHSESLEASGARILGGVLNKTSGEI